MNIPTTRFGEVAIEESDIITFVDGLIGMEDCRRWAVLADAHNNALAWLQSLDRADLALAVVSPRRYVSGYRVRVSQREVEPLRLDDPTDAQVLVVVSQLKGALTLNLKAPLVIHVAARLGRQIVARDDHPVQYVLSCTAALRKSA